MPKADLNKAMAEIEQILDKYDIAGMVVVHTPGSSQSLAKINPSYSCARNDGNKVLVRAKIEDFRGDSKAREKKLLDTCDMLNKLTTDFVNLAYPYFDVSERLDQAVGVTYDNGKPKLNKSKKS